MRKPTRQGSDAGHKKDYLTRRIERSLASDPGGLPLSGGVQTGAEPDESPGWIGGHYGAGPGARGLRRRGVKRSARKGMRRAGHARVGFLARGGDDRYEHSR